MSTRRCEECWAVLDPAKILRCTKCKACSYCSRACQTRNWRIHKRVCTTDPALRPFIRVEMAIERVLKKLPKMEQAPKDATCYICLEGDGASSLSKLMRGCACRGDSAGFVHLECLTELAMSKEDSDDPQVVFKGWNECGNCKQDFQGALELEMTRRFWRRQRSSPSLRYESTRNLIMSLGHHREYDAANQLLDEASTWVGYNRGMLLELKLLRADLRIQTGQNLEALGLLQAMLPEVEVCTAHPHLYGQTMQIITDLVLDLDRYQEAHETATKLVAFAKAKFGLAHPRSMQAVNSYAIACAELGRVEEAKEAFEDVLTIETRVLGRDHPRTQYTLRRMQSYGFA